MSDVTYAKRIHHRAKNHLESLGGALRTPHMVSSGVGGGGVWGDFKFRIFRRPRIAIWGNLGRSLLRFVILVYMILDENMVIVGRHQGTRP